MIVSVGRSPLRIVVLATLAVPAILLAVDMAFTHTVFPAPESNEVVVGTTINDRGETVDVVEDRLTKAGGRERNRERFFAALIGVAGAGVLVWALKASLNPTYFLVADGAGMAVRIGGLRHPMVRIPWDHVEAVRSGLIDDEGAEIQVFSIRFVDAALVPAEPVGARTEPPWLHVFADDWEVPAHRVAPVLDAHAGRGRVGAEE